jgi:lipid-binding SYLF domain-containing protein
MKRQTNQRHLSVLKTGAGLSLAAVMACSSSVQSAASANEAQAKARREVDDRLGTASDSLPQFRGNMPDQVAERPMCLVMIPTMVTAGLVIGGSGGKGFAACKTEHGWSPPAPVSIGGGSVGLQAGANTSDWLMLVMSDKAKRSLLDGHFKVGVDASATAGPVGTGAGAASDVQGGDTVSYSRSRGLFAGAVLNGATLTQDDDSTRALYGKPVPLRAILQGEQMMPDSEAAKRFIAQVRDSYGARPAASNDGMTAPANTPRATTLQP